MSYVPVFTAMMAQALAAAPTAEAALSVWNAMDEALAPTVGQVLHHAVPQGKLAIFQACRQWLGGAGLTPEEQGMALAGWRKSASDKPSSLSETQIMNGLLDLDLIQARARVRVRGHEEATQGPGAHLLSCLRFEAFEVLLDRMEMEQEDLDQCLHHLVERASGSSQRERWLRLVDRLLAAGANPQAEVIDYKLKSVLRQSAVQRVLSLASCWRDLPIEHQARLLGKQTLAQWNQASPTGHCPMVAWLQHGGDLQAACVWARDQAITPATLTRLVGVLLVRDQQEGGQGRVLEALRSLEALPTVDCEQMVELAHVALRTAISLHGTGDGVEPAELPGWWKARAGLLLDLTETGQRSAAGALLETAGQWLVRALGPGAGADSRSADTMDGLRQQLDNVRQTMQLEARTATASGRRFGGRL